MTDMMREMIQQLMGAQRAEEEGRKLPPYDSRDVCRAFLLDCCPREILADTRLENLIPCRKMHERAHQADYNNAQEKKDHFYDVEAFDALEEAVRAVDYEIEKTRKKVKKDSEHLSDSQDFIKTQKISELNDKINITLAQMEALGNEGKVQESVELSRTVSELQRKKQDMENELRSSQPVQQRLRVCDICGAQLNVLDHETRLADHYNGKMHLGMVQIREKYEEMKKTIDERRAGRREIDDKYYRSDRDRRRRSRSRSRDSRERRRRSRTKSRSRSPRQSSRSSRRRSRSRSYERRRR